MALWETPCVCMPVVKSAISTENVLPDLTKAVNGFSIIKMAKLSWLVKFMMTT